MTWSRATAIAGFAVVALAPCRSFVAIVTAPKLRDDRAWAPAGMTKEAALLQFNSVPDAGEQLKALGHDDHPNVGNLIAIPTASSPTANSRRSGMSAP